MNAYELAEKLEYDYWHAKANITMFKSADMLRQQADRIAELEKTFKPLTGDEINEIYLRHSNTRWGWHLDFAREIEERHGIKSSIEDKDGMS